jgi:hypothetical protein
MVGKHTGRRTRRSGWVAATVVLVALLAAGAVWVLVRAASDVAGSVTGPSPSSGTTSSTPTASATNSPTDSRLAKAQRALASCRSGVTQRERLAEAAAVTARDWKAHTDAQRQLDRGTWSFANAEAVWAKTKVRGSQDTKRFLSTAAKVREESSAADCGSVVADTASTPLAEQGTRCAARVKALGDVASTGAVLNTQWAAHVQMMADKAHTDHAAYHDRWVTMVAQAQAPLKRYAKASETLSKAPACSK